ncbi:hypothetical protein H0W80_01530 [Candidatus Saccharibacteria bacterium]|nr:hypothetical protein [Candidatus Saccharibacteria bacterium]
MKEFFGIAAGLLTGIAAIPYIIDIVRKKARPERASWFIWLVLAVIAFSTQFAEGATWSLIITAVDSIAVLIIFLLSIKYGEGRITRRDKIGLAVAGIGLVLWFITRHAVIALLFIVAVDASGVVLTLIKTYQEPDSETYTMWLLVAFAAIMSLLSVSIYTVGILIYPFYLFVANVSVPIAKYTGENLKLKKKSVKP